LNAAEFVAKWQDVELTERSAAQQHFLDLCEVVGHDKPAAADPKGEWFTFERGAARRGAGDGWADVWKRGFFAWEYKGKRKNLEAAYTQLLQYREALENPPLLVVCDLDRLIVHTNFTGTLTEVHEIPLHALAEAESLRVLTACFHTPEDLKPQVTRNAITAEAARRVAEIAQALRDRGLDPHEVALFLDRVVFCLFAEDVGLLPEDLFSRVLDNTRREPGRFQRQVSTLFEAMAHGGDFGADAIRHFNGNLFTGSEALSLTAKEIDAIRDAARLEWSAVDPTIFGTLFERGMDPAKRSQLGAHYTSREDIEALVEPVVMAPLRREWAEVRGQAEALLDTDKRNARVQVETLLRDFLHRLATAKVLDPACGSGNFLYVTLQKLKDLEKEVVQYALDRKFTAYLPQVGPWQLHGIEVNPYAFDLAQMTVWIGYLQWMREHGYLTTEEPVLRPMDTFQCKDAILELSPTRPVPSGFDPSDPSDPSDRSDALPGSPREPDWPEVDFIVGNPPFLGGKRMRSELGDEYVDALFGVWRGRVRAEADLCCYWFERARKHIEEGKCKRAGLLATQGIRGGANRDVLQRIKETGGIFFAESDRPWVLDGANVHVSMVGFDDGAEQTRSLDGAPVGSINPNLTSIADVTKATRLQRNADLAFMGDTKGGAFDIPEQLALEMLRSPNPHGRLNSEVVVPWVNGMDVTRRPRGMWMVDFGTQTTEADAAKHELPFEYLARHVKAARGASRSTVACWWSHERPRPDMRAALEQQPRFVGTARVSKHRLFVWMQTPTLPDAQLIVFARSDDYFFGVLHSRLHEVWARAQGTQLRERESGFRYTPTTCFETFPFPEPDPRSIGFQPVPGTASLADARRPCAVDGQVGDLCYEEVATAARELNELRERWLNPPEWTREEVLEFPGSLTLPDGQPGPWARYVCGPDDRGLGTVRYPRLAAKDADCAKRLAKRTLTNLYNERPTWLALAHRKLDEAVFAAYGWDPDLSDEEILEKLLALNLERAQTGA
jgi:type II restriction/modification system DNA methylase subunit YeeA